MLACPTCQRFFRPSGRRRFCSDACRLLAWDRQQEARVLVASPPAGQPRPPLSVYGCTPCGTRAPSEQRCERCQTPMVRVGLGATCPHCQELVAVADLIAEEVVP
jgi:endogenous inhibitor of DNA gyrase (YacG/DUF329 family)